jgi:hypothetical protein
MLAAGEGERFGQVEGELGVSLFPLGEAGNGHVFLAIGEDGRVYALMDEAWILGETMEEALDALVSGRSHRRI